MAHIRGQRAPFPLMLTAFGWLDVAFLGHARELGGYVRVCNAQE